MSRVFITGSAEGLGRGAAEELLDGGHRVVVHARSEQRLTALRDLLDRCAEAVVGDLADPDETRSVAEQVNRLGRMDAVIHNAAVMNGPGVLAVNVLAPYLLTALIDRPDRLVYLSSGMHRGGRSGRAALDWGSNGSSISYSDSKLLVSTLAAAVARRWPDVLSNSVNPGWVPTRMGGSSAPDDLRLGHVTQVWLATSNDQDAQTSGHYWHHQRTAAEHPAVLDVRFQDELLAALADRTGTALGG